MTFGRRRRPDDWATNHARARTALSDRLDGVLEPSEAGWLDDHLTGCPECRAVAADYDAQRSALRDARAGSPAPPRDLWARTAAAIERESAFRDRRPAGDGAPRRSALRSPLIATALVVVVAVGTLISSQLPGGVGPTAPSPASSGGAASDNVLTTAVPNATPIVVGEHVQWISRDRDGLFRLTNWDVNAVCPDGSGSCTSAPPVQDQPVDFTTEPQTVFGSRDGKRLIVVNHPNQSTATSISVVEVPSSPSPDASPAPSDTPTIAPATSPTAAPTDNPSATPSALATPTRAPSAAPTSTPSAHATGTPRATPTSAASSAPTSSEPVSSPSVSITPSESPTGPVQIAANVVLVGQSAAYSPDFQWFAFTARPADGVTGTDIYLWKVGDAEAHAVTTDHRSTFGSWTADDRAVGSSIVETGTSGDDARADVDAISFVLDPATNRRVNLPQIGRAWRPAVDPTGHRAVYWAGSLRQRSDAPVFGPSTGRLVVGDWNVEAAAPSDAPVPTPLKGEQGSARHETTIEAGHVEDWDARWDSTGTKLAVWIADANHPDVGTLGLYAVDPFDGRIDLKTPLLDPTRAAAGFSMSEGKLVWAEPAADGSATGGQVLVLAWNAQGTGTVHTASGEVVVIR